MRYSTARVRITTMKFFFDFFPVILFFVAYKFFGDLPPEWLNTVNQVPMISLDSKKPTDAIFFATLVIIIATIIQNIGHFFVYKKLEKMHLISLGILLVFGTMTLALKDPLFIKWKVSIFNWVFAAVIIGSQFIGKKPLIERMMSHAIAAPKAIWKRINLSWGIFFAFVGLVNIYVAYTYSEEAWVNFKLFGMLGLTFVFMIAQGIYLAKHGTAVENSNDTETDK